jgi:hypothetical protein
MIIAPRAWVSEFRGRKAAEDLPGAVEVLSAAHSRGDLLAQVELAILGRHAGLTHEEADSMVESAHSQAPEDDSELHFAVFQAYDLYLGVCEPEEKPARAFEHLVACASFSTNPMDAFAVATTSSTGGRWSRAIFPRREGGTSEREISGIWRPNTRLASSGHCNDAI